MPLYYLKKTAPPPKPVHLHKKKKRPYWWRVFFWSALSAAFTFGVSYLTRGLWEPEKNIHFVEFATIIMTMAEEA